LTAPGGGPSLARVTGQPGCGGKAMQWKTPVIVEIAVGLEINAYACAEI
jgi:coenzyme PQQ precursor peptide PqqA